MNLKYLLNAKQKKYFYNEVLKLLISQTKQAEDLVLSRFHEILCEELELEYCEPELIAKAISTASQIICDNFEKNYSILAPKEIFLG